MARAETDLTVRGVAAIAPDTPPDEIAAMSVLGIIGVRLNLIGQAFDQVAVVCPEHSSGVLVGDLGFSFIQSEL